MKVYVYLMKVCSFRLKKKNVNAWCKNFPDDTKRIRAGEQKLLRYLANMAVGGSWSNEWYCIVSYPAVSLMFGYSSQDDALAVPRLLSFLPGTTQSGRAWSVAQTTVGDAAAALAKSLDTGTMSVSLDVVVVVVVVASLLS